MSEETRSPEEKARPIDPEALRKQADEIRQLSYVRTEQPPKPPKPWAQIAYIVILVVVIGSALVLLISSGTRLWLLRGFAGGWTKVSAPQAEVFKLPPPPPKPVEPKIIQQGTPTFTFRAGGVTAVGIAPPKPAPRPAEPDTTVATEPDESKPAPPPEKTTEGKAAYDLLVKNSEVVRKLTTNGFPDLQFKEWKPVRNSPPDFWIDIVAVRAGQNMDFVWSVNAESGTVRAMSQNARDLEKQ